MKKAPRRGTIEVALDVARLARLLALATEALDALSAELERDAMDEARTRRRRSRK